MPSFNFSSGSGSSLTEKIAAINARQTAAKKVSMRSEEEAEEELIEQVSENKMEEFEGVINEASKEPVVSRCVESTGNTPEQLAILNNNIKELVGEFKKINKHVNSIVKMMKKD